MRLIAAGTPRAAPYDRNPTSQAQSGNALLSENTGTSGLITYTVPAGKKAYLGILSIELLCEVAATSAATTHKVYLEPRLTPSGGAEAAILHRALNVPAMVAGDRAEVAATPGLTLQAGDAMTIYRTFDGQGGGAGRVHIWAHVARTEFDA